MKRLLLTEVEFCQTFGMTYRTLSTICLPYIKLGRTVLYDVDDIYEWWSKSAKFNATVDLPIERYTDNEEIKGVGQLSLAFGVSYQTLIKRVQSGEIPSRNTGGIYVFKVAEIKAWINKKKTEATAQRKECMF